MSDAIDDAAFANLLEMTGGDQEFVDELVDTYLGEGERLVDAIGAAAAAGRVEDIVLPAHSMKSSSLNVGALLLGELCRRLEEEARGGSVAEPVQRAEEIRAAFVDARAALLDERQRRQAG